MNIDLNTLTDTQLATCVDLYIQRAMRAAHELDEDARLEWCDINIRAQCNNLEESYEIKHEVNSGWGTSQKYSGNNVIHGAIETMGRYLNDKRAHAPTKVQAMLAAPSPQPMTIENVEDAEFDDVPF